MEEKKNIANKAEIPSFVYRDGMLADMEYAEWLADVVTKSHQLGDQLEDEKGQQVADQLEMPESFGKAPWFPTNCKRWLTVRWLNWN